MKKNLIFALCFVILSVFSCYGKSLIVFDKTEHDFGKVRKKAVVKHTFNFENKGSSTLVIDRIKAGCSCTGTLLSENEIPAGGNGKLEIELEADSSGEMIRKIYVYTNDPNNEMITITVKATVIDE